MGGGGGGGWDYLTIIKFSNTNFESNKETIAIYRNVDPDFMGNIRGPAGTILLEGVCRNIFKLWLRPPAFEQLAPDM